MGKSKNDTAKKKTKKLEVKKETLRHLDDADLGQAAGGLFMTDPPATMPSRNYC